MDQYPGSLPWAITISLKLFELESCTALQRKRVKQMSTRLRSYIHIQPAVNHETCKQNQHHS